MANFSILGSDTTPETLIDDEEGFVAQNGQLVVNAGSAITASESVNIGVLGSVVALQANAVDMDGSSIRMSVGQSGYVAGLNAAALDLDISSFADIDNAGVITSTVGDVIDVDTQSTSANLFLYNSGEIFGDQPVAASLGFGNFRLTNTGQMSGRNDGVIVSALGAEVTNTGFIANEIGSQTLFSPAFGFTGTGGAAANNTLIFTNSGTLEGGILSNNAVDSVINTGFIEGIVNLGDGADSFDGRGGTVAGEVQGGTGDDTYIIDDSDIELFEEAGSGTDTVQAAANYALAVNFENLTLIGAENIDGTGNDAQNTIGGNAGDNKLTGLGSRDTINGHAGDDAIDAGRGNDVVDGGEGDDAIAGRAGDDILNGDNGSDFIFGGIGSDTINGGSGDDRIKGGAARDELTGAAGSDTFIFCSVTDSTLGPGSDRISDFEVGNDKLDFTNLISGQLTLASGSHTGGGTASVFTSTTGSGNTNVLVDVDGDGSSDMRVVLLGSSGLTETDFIL